ncbi:MAG TPA: MFS transporter [Gaiellaceae bacterium]|nr:MFS transporter [Gaiellaceae bacterium]
MPPFLARQRAVFRSSPSFTLLFGSYLVSGLGTFLAVVALSVDVWDRTHSGVWVSALLIADFLPAVAIGLLLGPLVDRLSRKRLLVGADIVRVVVFVLLAFTVSTGQIVALALLAGIATGFARPAAYAGLPNLVSAVDLPQANGLLRLAEQLTITFGALIGGIVVAAAGPDPAYVVNAVSFAVSGLLLLRIPRALLQRGKVESRGHWHDVGEGFRLVLHSRPLLTVLLSWNLAMLTVAFVNVSEIVLAKVSFDAGDFGFGLLWSANGLGAVIGALFASTWLERRGMTVLYGLAIALMGIADIGAAVSPNVWIAFWCVVLSGIGNATALVCNTLLVQRGAPDQLRGRAFTLIMGTNFAVLGIGMVIAGPLVDAVGARWVWGIAGGIGLVAAAAGYTMLRREPAAAVPEPAPT